MIIKEVIYNAKTKQEEVIERELTQEEIDNIKEKEERLKNELNISELKQQLIPIKEDVEQVELFGMVRDDYAEKKARCADIINQIRILMGKEPRELEKEV